MGMCMPGAGSSPLALRDGVGDRVGRRAGGNPRVPLPFPVVGVCAPRRPMDTDRKFVPKRDAAEQGRASDCRSAPPIRSGRGLRLWTTGASADYPTMIDAGAGDAVRARLSALLDDLEFHRAFDVEDRLARAVRLQPEAAAAGATDLQMRARLVESDMRLRIGQATQAAHLATEVNRWAREHGPPPLLARSHLILSSIFKSIGDSASCLDNALRALELLDDDAPERTRGNFLVRLADALSVIGSFDAARQRYREAEQHFVAIGDTERRVSALNNLAYAEYEAGDPKRAWDAAQEMRSVAERSDYVLTPPLLDTLARAHIGVGEYDQAAAVLEEALQPSSSGATSRPTRRPGSC